MLGSLSAPAKPKIFKVKGNQFVPLPSGSINARGRASLSWGMTKGNVDTTISWTPANLFGETSTTISSGTYTAAIEGFEGNDGEASVSYIFTFSAQKTSSVTLNLTFAGGVPHLNGGTKDTTTDPSYYIYTITASMGLRANLNIYRAYILLVGAGGGGGGGIGGGGGGGGHVMVFNVDLQGGITYSIGVSNGGLGLATQNDVNSLNGGHTVFGTRNQTTGALINNNLRANGGGCGGRKAAGLTTIVNQSGGCGGGPSLNETSRVASGTVTYAPITDPNGWIKINTPHLSYSNGSGTGGGGGGAGGLPSGVNGGAGFRWTITNKVYGAGGGCGSSGGVGGTNAGNGGTLSSPNGTNGLANFGGGGGGGYNASANGGNGGSGVIVVAIPRTYAKYVAIGNTFT